MSNYLDITALVEDVQMCADKAARECDARYQTAAAEFPTIWRTADEMFFALGKFGLRIGGSPVLALSDDNQVEYGIRKEAEWLLTQLAARGNRYQIYDDTRSGFNGGLRGLLSDAFIARRSCCIEAAQLTAIHRFLPIYDQLSCEEQMVVADTYWERFGSLYPPSSLAKHREWRAMRFGELISNHWTLVAPLRQALRG